MHPFCSWGNALESTTSGVCTASSSVTILRRTCGAFSWNCNFTSIIAVISLLSVDDFELVRIFLSRLFALDLFCCKINDYISESGAISCSNVRCVFFLRHEFSWVCLALVCTLQFCTCTGATEQMCKYLQRLLPSTITPIPIAKDVEAYSNAIVEEKIIMFMQWKRNETEICWPIEDVEHHDNKRKNILWQFKWLCPPLRHRDVPIKTYDDLPSYWKIIVQTTSFDN